MITNAATAAYSVPSLVLAALLWAFAAYKWKLFPEGGYVGLTDNPRQWFWHLLLPWTAAALPFAGAIPRSCGRRYWKPWTRNGSRPPGPKGCPKSG